MSCIYVLWIRQLTRYVTIPNHCSLCSRRFGFVTDLGVLVVAALFFLALGAYFFNRIQL
jgi:hypothetical protein